MTVKISGILSKGPVGNSRWIAAEKVMYPIIIDAEASGFGTDSYPIEVGVALGDASRHCYLVSPARR